MLRGRWGLRATWRLIWRGGLTVGLIAYGIAELVIRRPGSQKARARWTQQFCGRVIRALGIPVTTEGQIQENGILLANHQTYLDIAVLASLRPCVFVSKAEVARWPVVGWMTTMAGTVFVERGRGGSAAEASVGMLAAAKEGLPVVIFPEGTTSNGRGLLPFRGGLISEARAAELPVRVAVIRYRVDGPAGVSLEDDVAYWGDRGLLEHVARFLTLEGVQVRVRFEESPVAFRTADRKQAAAEAREAMFALSDGSLERGDTGVARAGSAKLDSPS